MIFPGYRTAIRAITALQGSWSVSLTVGGGGGGGPATDYGLNPYLNDSAGAVAAANARRTLSSIIDGSSNTILIGYTYLASSDYALTTSLDSTRMSIFSGGTLGTARNGLGDTAATWLKDGAASTSNQWGSPMTEGGLMALGDATVRTFPYTTQLTNFLKADDSTPVSLP